MRKGDASLYRPEDEIGRPRFKAIKTPIAVRNWTCELCGGVIPAGRHYLRYFDRRPLEIDDCPYHFLCWAIINAYCIQNQTNKYTYPEILEWLNKKFCKRCKLKCNGMSNCKKIAKAINYTKPKYPFEEG